MRRLLPVIMIALLTTVQTQRRRIDTSSPEVNAERQRILSNDGAIDPEVPTGGPATLAAAAVNEAPAAFDNQTNGFDPQGPDFDTLEEDAVDPLASFNDNRFIFAICPPHSPEPPGGYDKVKLTS